MRILRPGFSRRREHAADDLVEPLLVRRAADEELLERLGRVDHDVPPLRAQRRDVEAEVGKRAVDRVAVRARRGDDSGVAPHERRTDEPAHGLEQVILALVELDEVVVIAHVAPTEPGLEEAA